MHTKNPYKVSFLAGLGGLLEFYDFILYILFSDQIAKEFFNNITNHAIQNFLVIAIFSAGYLIRPLGGMIFGWIGDTKGRKHSFSLTIMLMAISILLMSILPNYNQIGITAPILFTTLRMIQGLAIGGELPSAIVYIYESVNKKGLAMGIMFGMIFGGVLLGDFMSIVFRKYFDIYAWRVAFFSGALIAVVSYIIRAKLRETELFLKLDTVNKTPIITVLSSSPIMLICGILTVCLGSYYGVFIALFLPKYLTLHLNYSVLLVNKVMIASSIIGISVIILSSWLSDYINIYKLYALSSILLIIFSYKIFYYINSHNTLYMISAVYLLSFIVAIATGLVCRIICGLFSTEIRLTGVAICYNIAFALIGGTIPISTEILINKLNLIMAPTLISIIVGLLCLGAITIIKNHKGIDHQ